MTHAKLHAPDDLARRCAELEQQTHDLQRALTRTKASLRQAHDDLDALSTLVGQDMRAPLFSINGFTGELAQVRQHVFACWQDGREADPNQVQLAAEFDEAFGYLQRASIRLGSLVDSAAAIARGGRGDLTLVPIDTRALVRDVMAPLQDSLFGTDGTIVIAALPTCLSDEPSLREVFGYLLHNAMHQLRSGVPYHIEVDADVLPKSIEFHVHDNGRGLEPDELARVFEPTDRAPGVGVGLARARAIVRRLGGVVRARSEPGAGSTFSFELPRQA